MQGGKAAALFLAVTLVVGTFGIAVSENRDKQALEVTVERQGAQIKGLEVEKRALEVKNRELEAENRALEAEGREKDALLATAQERIHSLEKEVGTQRQDLEAKDRLLLVARRRHEAIVNSLQQQIDERNASIAQYQQQARSPRTVANLPEQERLRQKVKDEEKAKATVEAKLGQEQTVHANVQQMLDRAIRAQNTDGYMKEQKCSATPEAPGCNE